MCKLLGIHVIMLMISDQSGYCVFCQFCS